MSVLDVVLDGIGQLASLTGRWRFICGVLGGGAALAAASEMAAPRIVGYVLFIVIVALGAVWEWRDGVSHT